MSDEFLVDMQQMEKKNLALEALKKQLNDETHSRTQTNVVETKKCSERLEKALLPATMPTPAAPSRWSKN